MGSKKAPAPKITYSPPPPPPTIVQTPTQAVRTESALSEVAQAQQRLNMELGSQLDRTNEEFFAGQDIRRTQAVGTETRLGQKVAGQEERAGIRTTGLESRLGQRVAGKQQRQTIGKTGRESRLGQRVAGQEARRGIETSGTQERLTQAERFVGETGLTRVRGEESRLGQRVAGKQQRQTIGKTGTETRTTDLQQEMFRRYKENRDYEQAQQQYRA